MSDLHDDLTDIQGVGDATADKILDVIQDHDQEYRPILLKAFEAADRGDDREAAMYLRRANE
jgi:hypothetical protein